MLFIIPQQIVAGLQQAKKKPIDGKVLKYE
jgi:hypothetical protein